MSSRSLFKTRFTAALTRCINRGFCVEEVFGIIWEETIEEVRLSESDHHQLYNELLVWARDFCPQQTQR